MAKDGNRKFTRSVFGYDREEVEAELAKRDARLRRLEKEAGHLAERVLDRERRLHSALAQLEQSEKVRGEQRQEAEPTYAREPAARPTGLIARSVRMAERIAETAGVGDLLEAAGLLPPKQEERPKAKPRPPRPAPSPKGVADGKVEIDVGPLADFAQLTGFEDAVRSVGGATEVEVRGFSGGRATIEVRLDDPANLLRDLERNAPVGFEVRSMGKTRAVPDVADDKAQAA